MSKSITQINNSQTFQDWLNKTNEMTIAFSDTVTMNGDSNIGNVDLTGNLTLLPINGNSATLTVDEITSQLNPKKITLKESTVVVEGDVEIYNLFAEEGESIPKRGIKFYQENFEGTNTLEWEVSVDDYADGETIIPNGEFSIIGDTDQICKLALQKRNSGVSVLTGTNVMISYGILPFSDDTYLTPDQGDTNYVNVSGDTMTGNLTVGNTSNGVRLNSSDGSITATGEITAFGSLSDINVKENIEKIECALDKIDQISGYLFNYKGDDRRMTGVIAQEVEEVLPEVVYETVDNKGNDVKSVRYGNMMGLVIEAIKELRQEIKNLKS